MTPAAKNYIENECYKIPNLTGAEIDFLIIIIDDYIAKFPHNTLADKTLKKIESAANV